MKTITFTCETITPMFLSGADGTTPELRPPSIKGALRFWWRAMNGHRSLEELKAKEDEIFGGTEGRSKVLIRVSTERETVVKGSNILGYGLSNPFDGVKYLLYILFHQQSEREGFNKGTRFKITFSCKDENYLKDFCAAFWIFANLGSIGTRARRGAGAFGIVNVDDKRNVLANFLNFIQVTNQDLQSYLKSNLSSIRNRYPNVHKRPITKSYSTFPQSLYVSKQGFDSWQLCLDNIGSVMRKLRKGQTHKEKSKRTFTMDTLDQKAAFGLPISVFQDNSVNFKNNERRASPVYISVMKNINNKFHWTIFVLEGDFMPKDDFITFSSKKVKFEKEWERENRILISKFLEEIKPLSNQI